MGEREVSVQVLPAEVGCYAFRCPFPPARPGRCVQGQGEVSPVEFCRRVGELGQRPVWRLGGQIDGQEASVEAHSAVWGEAVRGLNQDRADR